MGTSRNGGAIGTSGGVFRSVGDYGGVLIKVPASTGLEQFAFT